MNDKLLTLNDVSLSYYGTDFSIIDINFELSVGKRTVIYGREGSGKTLLLRAIAGLEELDFGDIILDGKNLREVPLKERGIGFTFDITSLKGFKSISQVLAYPMELRGYAQDEITKSLKAACDDFELDEDTPIQSLGDFEKAKVLLARLFVLERRLYIVDDVWKDLERGEQVKIIELLKKAVDGKSAIVATQDIEFARALGGEVAVVSAGECTQAKDLQAHCKRPVNMETAILCGYEIFKSALHKNALGYYTAIGDAEYAVEPPLSDIYVGKDVCFAVDESGATGFYYDKDCERIISNAVDKSGRD